MLRRKYREIHYFDNGKTIIYKLNVIDSLRFMLTSLSKLVNNLSGIYNKGCRRV